MHDREDVYIRECVLWVCVFVTGRGRACVFMCAHRPCVQARAWVCARECICTGRHEGIPLPYSQVGHGSCKTRTNVTCCMHLLLVPPHD